MSLKDLKSFPNFPVTVTFLDFTFTSTTCFSRFCTIFWDEDLFGAE